MTANTGLVVRTADLERPALVGFVNPLTGEVMAAEDAAAVAAWMVDAKAFQTDILGEALRVAGDVLNAHLDHVGKASDTLEDDAGHVFEVKGETASAAADAIVVTDPEGLAGDLAALARRGQIDPVAAVAAVKRTVEYKPDARRIKALAARQDVVGETVRSYIAERGPTAPPPRPRKRPMVKRVA